MWVGVNKSRSAILARKKKIPSIDYSIKLIVEQLTADLGAEIDKVADFVASLGKRVTALERRLYKLRQEEHWAEMRKEFGIGAKGTRKRVSPSRAYDFILSRLRKADGGFVTSRDLGGPLGIGRATVATRIQELRDQGYEIISSPRKGYALQS
jgi:biotin operon repressor BirA-like protein